MDTNIIKCKDCFKDFALTEGEIQFYSTSIADDGQHMALPKRCTLCRKKRKDAKRQKLGGEYQRGLPDNK